MNESFRRGAREGMRLFLPMSVGLLPWAVVTGVAMRSTGFSPFEAMGMNLLVYAGTAQLGTLPLIAMNAPVWLIVATALVLNLRFVIFSAAIAPAFRGLRPPARVLGGFLLVDGVYATCIEALLKSDDPHWRWGCFIVPSLWAWCVWQTFVAVGVFGAGVIPRDWSLEFMATIALMVMLLPMLRERPMAVAALVGGLGAVVFHALPLRLGLFVGIVMGIAAGFVAEKWQTREAA